MKQKKLIFFFSSLALICSLTFIFCQTHLFKGSKKHRSKKSFSTVVEEKPFVVIIPSYNNITFCKRNIESVLSQHYHNYRVVFIDDHSEDGTHEQVREIVEASAQGFRCQLIRNSTNQGALSNLYQAIHSCRDEEIVVTVDGDDYLAHEEVLSKLNAAYSDPSVWMTYGNFLDYPSYTQKPVICKKLTDKVIRNNSFRSQTWVTSHLRTFYAGLFKKIKLQDLLFEGKFFPMAWDLAMMMPMLEMAGKHAVFIRDILYLYNRTNPLNDHKVNFPLQQSCANTIRKFPKYTRLKTLFKKSDDSEQKVDFLIFSYDRPLQLYALLESMQKQMSHQGKIAVIYRSSSSAFTKAYEQVNADFPQVKFIQQSQNPHADFQPSVVKEVFESSETAYIAFAVDDLIVKEPVDLQTCVNALKKTGAYGFYLTLGLHVDYCYMRDIPQAIPAHIPVAPQIYAWQFHTGEADWRYPNSVDLVIYNKEEIKKDFQKMHFTNPNTLEHFWNLRAKLKKIGLFYATSKCVNIPLNLVNISTNRNMSSYSTTELLNMFQNGLKIDIEPLQSIRNRSRHIDYNFSFTEKRQSQ